MKKTNFATTIIGSTAICLAAVGLATTSAPLFAVAGGFALVVGIRGGFVGDIVKTLFTKTETEKTKAAQPQSSSASNDIMPLHKVLGMIATAPLWIPGKGLKLAFKAVSGVAKQVRSETKPKAAPKPPSV